MFNYRKRLFVCIFYIYIYIYMGQCLFHSNVNNIKEFELLKCIRLSFNIIHSTFEYLLNVWAAVFWYQRLFQACVRLCLYRHSKIANKCGHNRFLALYERYLVC